VRGDRVFIHHHVACYSCHYCLPVEQHQPVRASRAFLSARVERVKRWPDKTAGQCSI
jgi:threonine dehydrogenase-like Zn-dependent dehydrogenase